MNNFCRYISTRALPTRRSESGHRCMVDCGLCPSYDMARLYLDAMKVRSGDIMRAMFISKLSHKSCSFAQASVIINIVSSVTAKPKIRLQGKKSYHNGSSRKAEDHPDAENRSRRKGRRNIRHSRHECLCPRSAHHQRSIQNNTRANLFMKSSNFSRAGSSLL